MVTVWEPWIAAALTWTFELKERVVVNESDVELSLSEWNSPEHQQMEHYLLFLSERGDWTPVKRQKGKREPNETKWSFHVFLLNCQPLQRPSTPHSLLMMICNFSALRILVFLYGCVLITPLVVNFSLYFLVSVKISFLNVYLSVLYCNHLFLHTCLLPNPFYQCCCCLSSHFIMYIAVGGCSTQWA